MLNWNGSSGVRRPPAAPEPAEPELLQVPDPVVAEVVSALESLFGLERARIAEVMRTAIDLPSVSVLDEALLLRALELYERHRLGFADAYLAAAAERAGGR